ncbi:MAG TPA: cryptochrome/photolyase family protein [Nocardioidaceae bacterium]|nr:cryptochrome/photolyase family protein [Nocardioidaceae bacterium]
MATAQIVFPHQLFREHLGADADTLMVLVEPDLFFRQLAFHLHKLVLHRASMRSFEDRLRDSGFRTEYVATNARTSSDDRLATVLRRHKVDSVRVHDVVDDWLGRDLRRVCRKVGADLTELESPGFVTTREQIDEIFARNDKPRMQHFYEAQRRRLDLLMDGDDPVGGRWSYDTENRKSLPKDITLPAMPQPTRNDHVEDAITTKPYVSGSNYLRKTGDFPTGDWSKPGTPSTGSSWTTTATSSPPTREPGWP